MGRFGRSAAFEMRSFWSTDQPSVQVMWRGYSLAVYRWPLRQVQVADLMIMRCLVPLLMIRQVSLRPIQPQPQRSFARLRLS